MNPGNPREIAPTEWLLPLIGMPPKQPRFA